jgi:polar amino acid transport system permease protein
VSGAPGALVILLHVDWSFLWERISAPGVAFWPALRLTVVVAVLAQFFGVVLGLFSALAWMSRALPLRLLAYLYVLVIRGTPVIVQIFFIYYGTNLLMGYDLFPKSVSFGLFSASGAVVAGTVALSVNEGAYMSEIIRAGIRSIDLGQMEAAKSVGMPYRLAMRRIILPQAARVIIPPLGNEFNNMLKTTSLLAFIGVYEIFLDAENAYSTSFRPVEVFTAVALWYLLLTTLWGVIQYLIERRLSASDRGEDETLWSGIFGQSGQRLRRTARA